MAGLGLSSKRMQIDKANSTIVLVVSIAAVVTAFSLMSVRALLGQKSYQGRVITEQTKALGVSDKNVKAVDALVASYKAFNDTPDNIIGGSTAGRDKNNGDNSKIILDALPSQYDFPALISSYEKIFKDRNFDVGGIAGATDMLDGTAPTTAPGAAVSTAPPATAGTSAVEIPLQLTVKGSYDATQEFLSALDRNIRPVYVNSMEIIAGQGSATVSVTAKTFYQPGKSLQITSKVIK